MRKKSWWSSAAAAFSLAVMSAGSASGCSSKSHSAATVTAQARPISVTVASVQRRDVPIYLDGLGSVSALKTVTVKTQVDGRLDQVLFKEGQAVRRGQVLAQVDPRSFQIQLQQARGALARDEAQLRGARLNLQRYEKLSNEKLIAQQTSDDQATTVGQLEGTVEVDKANVAAARLSLDYARITSPVDGITGIRQIDPGNVVHTTDTSGIVIVTQLDPITVIFTLPQDQLAAIRREMERGDLSVDVFARDGSALGSGHLALIDNQINQTTSTLRLKAILPNPHRLLWPNQFVNVRLRLTTRRAAFVLPTTALLRGPSGTYVYVVNADATASIRPIQVELSQGEVTIASSGLQGGERVVVDGQNLLRAGARVAARESPPNGETSSHRDTTGHEGQPHSQAGGQGTAR